MPIQMTCDVLYYLRAIGEVSSRNWELFHFHTLDENYEEALLRYTNNNLILGSFCVWKIANYFFCLASFS